MRRNTFLKSLLAVSATGTLPLAAQASTNLKMMIPANPGGGWDTTGRALGKALLDGKLVESVAYENKGGAAGALGLAQFVNSAKGDPNALMVMGAVMLGGIITGKPPVNLTQATPIARLSSEYNVFVVPANSPLKTMKDVVDQLKRDPGSVKWGGGSRGSTEHIAACILARSVGRGSQKGQLRGIPGRRRSDDGHSGRQCDRGWQRIQRVCRVHCRRQDARNWRHVPKAAAGRQRTHHEGTGL
jgi:putative tricarboxylic transport membrane protein